PGGGQACRRRHRDDPHHQSGGLGLRTASALGETGRSLVFFAGDRLGELPAPQSAQIAATHAVVAAPASCAARSTSRMRPAISCLFSRSTAPRTATTAGIPRRRKRRTCCSQECCVPDTRGAARTVVKLMSVSVKAGQVVLEGYEK